MRTKALLCAAALAAGIVTSMAQSNVYSLNVVGYYNIPVNADQWYLIANQLNTSDNTIKSLLASAPDGAQLQKYSGSYQPYVYDILEPGWTPDGDATLNPGEGAFFKSPVATTLTFVGEVMQGSLTNTLPIGAYAIRSSMVPQQGLASNELLIPGEDGDQLQTYRGGSYQPYVYDILEPGWTPSQPTISVGEAFFYRKAPTSTTSQWVRNFTVQ